MTPQSVTSGARVARKVNVLLVAAAQRTPDKVAFFGGVLATISGMISGVIGSGAAAELLRICIGKLEAAPLLELPPGVREAMSAANLAEEPAPASSAARPENKDGPCCICKAQLGFYATKWIHADGRLVCFGSCSTAESVEANLGISAHEFVKTWRHWTDG